MVTEKRREYEREWKRNNRDKVNAWNKAHRKQKAEYDEIYYLKNKETKQLQTRAWYLNNKEIVLYRVKEWRKNNIEKCRKSATKYKKLNPQKKRAHWNVKHRVDSGTLIKNPCRECGEIIVEAHHEDYSKPVDVIWLCRKHHRELHRRYLLETLQEKIERISQ